jgi:hypothetical protein
MNDNEVLTAVRDSFSEVRMCVPLDQTVRRGRVLRARRRGSRVAALAGAAALAAVTAVTAVNLGAPARSVPVSPGNGGLALDAWTVTVGPDHTVNVTVRQLSNAAGLQQALRADGIPARVAFQAGTPSDTPPLPAGCRNVAMSDEANATLQGKIISTPVPVPPAQIALALHPRAIPHGIGIYLAIQSGSSSRDWGWGLDLVQAASTCTG